jgi:nicotinamidase-related amidase
MKPGLQPRRARGKVAVLALDLITDFDFPDGPKLLRALTRRAAAIRHLLALARDHRVPVIYANDNLGPWRSDSRALITHCTASRFDGAALVSSLLPAASDEIVLKPRHSAFFGTPFAALLDQHGIDTLVITGISAESCVWMTACDAHTRGFRLVIPADTIAGTSPSALRRTLASLENVLKARVPAMARSLRFKNRKLT